MVRYVYKKKIMLQISWMI